MIPLKYRASLDKSEMVSGLNDIRQMAGSAGAVMSKGFTSGAAALTSAALAAKALINNASEIADFSTQANIGTEEFQRMGFAFQQSGTKSEGYRNALINLNATTQDALAGSKAMMGAYDKLGISMDSLQGKDTGEVMMMIADAASEATDKGKAMAAIIDLMGRSGKTMAGTLLQGRDAIEELGKSATIAAKESIAILDAEGDMLNKTWTALKATGMELLSRVLDPMGARRSALSRPKEAEEVVAQAETAAEWEERIVQANKEKYDSIVEQSKMQAQYVERLNKENDIQLENARLQQKREQDEARRLEEQLDKQARDYLDYVDKKIQAEEKFKQVLLEEQQMLLGQGIGRLAGAQEKLNEAIDKRAEHIGENPNERRQRLRDERKQDRLERRAEEDRKALDEPWRKRRGARPGDARDMKEIEKAQKEVKLEQDSINKLVDAIEKLLVKP